MRLHGVRYDDRPLKPVAACRLPFPEADCVVSPPASAWGRAIGDAARSRTMSRLPRQYYRPRSPAIRFPASLIVAALPAGSARCRRASQGAAERWPLSNAPAWQLARAQASARRRARSRLAGRRVAWWSRDGRCRSRRRMASLPRATRWRAVMIRLSRKFDGRSKPAREVYLPAYHVMMITLRDCWHLRASAEASFPRRAA